MSKSLGNFFTVRDLLAQGVPGEVIRFVFLSTHYRKPMDWTAEKAAEAGATLRKWYAQVASQSAEAEPGAALVAALADDLNTHGALAQLHKLSNSGNSGELRAGLRLLGLMAESIPQWAAAPDVDLTAHAARLARARELAMQSKDFSEVDRLKAAFVAAGVEVRMSKAGVELVPGAGFDGDKLEAVR